MGSPRWTRAQTLESVRVTCVAGASLAPTVLTLEVNGVLVEQTVVIAPSVAGQSLHLLVPLRRVLAAGSTIRWKVTAGPGDVTNLGLTLVVAAAGTSVVVPGQFVVRWVKGGENIPLFQYDPATHLYTETSAGISTGRASIANATTFLAQIEGETVWRADALTSALHSNRLFANGGVSTSDTPRLEWWHGTRRVASVTKAGELRVMDVEENALISGGQDRFEFYGGGVLVAVLSRVVQLVAKQFVEPI